MDVVLRKCSEPQLWIDKPGALLGCCNARLLLNRPWSLGQHATLQVRRAGRRLSVLDQPERMREREVVSEQGIDVWSVAFERVRRQITNNDCDPRDEKMRRKTGETGGCSLMVVCKFADGTAGRDARCKRVQREYAGV